MLRTATNLGMPIVPPRPGSALLRPKLPMIVRL
jgi:hypothetical protein